MPTIIAAVLEEQGHSLFYDNQAETFEKYSPSEKHELFHY